MNDMDIVVMGLLLWTRQLDTSNKGLIDIKTSV